MDDVVNYFNSSFFDVPGATTYYLIHMTLDAMDSLQTNFIVLGYPRSGSTFLSLALESHRHIRMYLELFHHDPHVRRTFYRADLHPAIGPDGRVKVRRNARYYRSGEPGDQFLREAVYYDRHSDRPLAVGFKMFYNHARDDEHMKTAWDFLIERTDIRVIHLIRRNLLEEKLSREQARLSGQWTKYVGESGATQEMPALVLEPSDCEQSFNRILAYRAWATSAFREHPFIEIVYEDHLVSRFQDTMLTLQGFLSIPHCRTRVVTEKQSTVPTKLQITNYDELRERFRHTIHATYFTD